MTIRQFEGPLFLVGMPRSGTKLLRDLLNNHSMIGIAPNESHFIPEFYSRLKMYEPLDRRENFDRFFHDLRRTPFFQLVKGETIINGDKLFNAVPQRTFSGFIEGFYLAICRGMGKNIWGDKTPFYLIHLPLFKSLFPAAKFIHIIRDVRDYSLSLKKTWHKNLLRSSQRWHDSVQKCRKDGFAMGQGNYCEVTYEQLVDNPEVVTRELCRFVGVPFEQSMTVLQKPVDQGGDTSNRMDILSRNYGKWRTSMTAREVRKIEELCGNLLADLGYDISYRGEPKRLGMIQEKLLRLADGIGLMRFELSRGGISGAYKSLLHTLRYADSRRAKEEQEE